MSPPHGVGSQGGGVRRLPPQLGPNQTLIFQMSGSVETLFTSCDLLRGQYNSFLSVRGGVCAQLRHALLPSLLAPFGRSLRKGAPRYRSAEADDA
jgi:hypothetical protein